MIIGKLELNEAQTINFGINVFGTTQVPTEIRFVIEAENFDIICKCRQNGEDLEVDIPKLKGILESKEYKTKLEVIIDNKIFTPLKESIEFNQLVEFDLNKKSIESKVESAQITIKPIEVITVDATPIKKVNSSLQENLDKVKKHYTVVEMENHHVLVKDGMFHGFVSATAILEADKGYDSLNLLVEALSNKK